MEVQVLKNRGIVMIENKQKSLIKINENSIFYKIKQFLMSLFNRNNNDTNNSISFQKIENFTESKNNKKIFVESIKNIENEETKLLKLQKQYRSGEIKEEELTEEQVNSLCALYDRQIENLKKSNEIRKQKLAQYRKKLQTDN